MAVIVQKMVGAQHDGRFYPDFAGVAKSYNFYPLPPQKPADGIVSVALGLGKWVVDGGNAVTVLPEISRRTSSSSIPRRRASTPHSGSSSRCSWTRRPTSATETHDILVKQSRSRRRRAGRDAQLRRVDVLAGKRRDQRRPLPSRYSRWSPSAPSSDTGSSPSHRSWS